MSKTIHAYPSTNESTDRLLLSAALQIFPTIANALGMRRKLRRTLKADPESTQVLQQQKFKIKLAASRAKINLVRAPKIQGPGSPQLC